MQQERGFTNADRSNRNLYSIMELEQVTEVPLRTLQFWVTSGILEARGSSAHPGRGRTRYFAPHEARMAIALRPLYEGGMSTAKLKELADEVRPRVTSGAEQKHIQLIFSDGRWRLSADGTVSSASLPSLLLPLS